MRRMIALKAYACTEDCEGTGGIIFAKSNIEARKSASSIWGDGELRGWRVHRAPGLDQYAGSGVPASVLISDGWWFECTGCGMTMSEDNLLDVGLSAEGVIGKENGQSFCCHKCRIDYKSDQAARNAYGEAFLDMMKGWLVDRFGSKSLNLGEFRHHVYVPESNTLVVEQARVCFDFPGRKYAPATLQYEKNGQHNHDEISCGRWFYSVSRGDAEAYKNWASNFPRKGYI